MDNIGRINQAPINTNFKAAAAPKKKEAPAQQAADSVSLGNKEDKAPKKWTIMHYSAADNNLTSYLVGDVNEMEKVGSNDLMNIIVKLDKGGSDCKTYKLEQDDNSYQINSPVLEEHGQTNMSDPKVLANFIKETSEKFPAEHYALIISDHGYAWKGAVEDKSDHGWMTTPDIKKALDMSGKKLDVVGFDACLMATSEVAYELKDNAKFLVASEQSEGANGWPYTPLLNKKTLGKIERAMRSKLDLSPEDFAKKVVDVAADDQGTLPTMSATDLGQMKQLADATNVFAGQLMLTDTPKDVLKDISRKTEKFYGDFKDQGHFAKLVVDSDKIADKELKKAAKGMMDAIKKAVVAEQHSGRHPNAQGLSAEIPSYGKVDAGYDKLTYAKHTLWDEAMNHINK